MKVFNKLIGKKLFRKDGNTSYKEIAVKHTTFPGVCQMCTFGSTCKDCEENSCLKDCWCIKCRFGQLRKYNDKHFKGNLIERDLERY